MSIVSIQIALETQLATVAGALPTVSENTAYVPVAKLPYQRVDLLPAEPENPTQDGGFHREVGIFQIMLCYPIGMGAGDAKGQAELIRAAFQRGASFAANGVTVQIERTPTVAAAMMDGDRYCVPVRVRYFANVYT